MNENVYLITGGRGAIGSALTTMLSRDGSRKIYVVDDLSAGEHNSKAIGEYIHCDVSNNEKLKNLIKKISPTHVFHLAAHFANQNSVDFPLSDAQTNILGTINLFEALRCCKLKKVVFASSSCVYGHSTLMTEDDDVGAFETPYAISKYAGELYTKYYAHVHKIPAISIRIFNTYGPGEVPGKYRNVIPKFIDLALDGRPITITGDGHETRDFTYIDDTVNLLMLGSQSEVTDGGVFNGGTGIGTKIVDLANLIIRLTGSSSKVVFEPRRYWDKVSNRVAINEKSCTTLGYAPMTSLETGLIPTINWIRLNRIPTDAN